MLCWLPPLVLPPSFTCVSVLRQSWSPGPIRLTVSVSGDSIFLNRHCWVMKSFRNRTPSPIGHWHSIITIRFFSSSFALITNQTDKKCVFENSFTVYMHNFGYSLTLLLHRFILMNEYFLGYHCLVFSISSKLNKLTFRLIAFSFPNDNRTLKTTQSKQDTVMNHCFRSGSPYATQRVGVRLNEKRALGYELLWDVVIDNPNRILEIANCGPVPPEPDSSKIRVSISSYLSPPTNNRCFVAF